MLLRLLPAPTATQANPPTILFTLPLPTHPYTARSLPLPPNLLAHRSVCLQEDVDCPNVLLGDKASWICGVIDDVTFSLPAMTVTVNFIDNTQIVEPIYEICAALLRRVCREVELSFAPQPEPEVIAPTHRRTSSSSSVGSVRRSPSSLLYSLLSPLLPTAAASINRPPPARVHRRQARSLLVDTFRRFVLPSVKARLPTAYLTWAVASETKRKLDEFEQLRCNIDQMLCEAGVDKLSRIPLKRYRTYSNEDLSDALSMSPSSSSGADSEDSTPATSLCSSGPSSPFPSAPLTPQSFLLTAPPAQALPVHYQQSYATSLARVSYIATRLASLKRLHAKYEREEGKRLWLEGLERGRAGDKALKRALANGELKPEQCRGGVEPMRRSRLWRSWTAEDQDKADALAHAHPAMQTQLEDDTPEMTSDSDEDAEEVESVEEDSPRTPVAPTFPQRAITIRLPGSGTGTGSLSTCFEEEYPEQPMPMATPLKLSRPPLDRRSDHIQDDDSMPDMVSDREDEYAHPLSTHSSSESLSSGSDGSDWDDVDEIRTPSPPPTEAFEDAPVLPLLAHSKAKSLAAPNWVPELERPSSRLAFRRVSHESPFMVSCA